jgi:hypothetical protein
MFESLTSQAVIWALAAVLLVAYLAKRRARLSRED